MTGKRGLVDLPLSINMVDIWGEIDKLGQTPEAKTQATLHCHLSESERQLQKQQKLGFANS